VALFPIAKSWNEPRCPSRDGWVKKVYMFIYLSIYLSIHPSIIYLSSAIKKNEIMSFAGKWVELSNEIYQTQEEKKHMFSLIYIECRLKKILESRKGTIRGEEGDQQKRQERVRGCIR
jgi:hypothetical protein